MTHKDEGAEEEFQVRLRGEDVEDGLRDWIKSDIRDGRKQSYELGRFLFSVSLGAAGLFIAIGKLKSDPKSLSALLGLAVALWLASAAAALDLAIPKIRDINSQIDLFEAYNAHVVVVRRHVLTWLILWITGTLLATVSLWT